MMQGKSGMPTFWESLKQSPVQTPPTTNLEYALKYAANGWHIIPCYTIKNGACACGESKCNSPGKHPMNNHGVKNATTDATIITEWFTQWPDANIGVATGRHSGFFAVDVDIKHDLGKFGDVSLEQLESDHGKMPDTVLAKTGSGGLHYLFKYPNYPEIANSTSKLGGSIDVRGIGGYIIVEPSLHISGHAYTWEASSDPLTDAKILDAPQWLLNLTAAKKNDMKPNAEGMYFQSSELDAMSDDQLSDLMQALAFCPNIKRDDWLDIGMAIHSMDSTIKGLTIWETWSATCAKFNAEDQARVWASFNNNKKDKKNKETLFYIARKNGYISAAEKLKSEQNTEQASAIIEAINNPTIYQATDPTNYQATDPTNDPTTHQASYQTTNQSTDQTNQLSTYQSTHQTNYQPTNQSNTLFPVQILNRLAGFINAGSSCYSETATAQAVLSVASLLASRRYLTPQDDSCQLYLGISSGSVGSIGELRYTSRGVRQILQQCGLRRMVRESRLSSTQALYKTLFHSPASIYICDDYSAMIKLCQRQTTGGIEVVLNTLTRIFDDKFIQLDAPEEAGLKANEFGSDGKPVIIRPSLSMISLMHYSQLATFAKVSELGRGAVEQFLFAICDNEDMIFKEESPVILPEDVIASLLNIRGISAYSDDMQLHDIFNELSGVPPVMIPVEFESKVAKYDAMIDSVAEDRRHRMFKNGARKNMRRLMTILSAFDDPLRPVATKSIMEWSAEYVAGNLARLLEVLDVVVSDDGKADIGQLVLDAIIKQGPYGINPGALVNFCRPYKALSKDKRQELIDKMIDDKDIKIIESKKISGQKSKVIVYSKFHTENNG